MNPHEEAARGRKVLALLARVPAGRTPQENQVIAEWLAGLSVPERGIFAKLARCNFPSEETWRELLDAVRARKTVDELAAEFFKERA